MTCMKRQSNKLLFSTPPKTLSLRFNSVFVFRDWLWPHTGVLFTSRKGRNSWSRLRLLAWSDPSKARSRLREKHSLFHHPTCIFKGLGCLSVGTEGFSAESLEFPPGVWGCPRRHLLPASPSSPAVLRLCLSCTEGPPTYTRPASSLPLPPWMSLIHLFRGVCRVPRASVMVLQTWQLISAEWASLAALEARSLKPRGSAGPQRLRGRVQCLPLVSGVAYCTQHPLACSCILVTFSCHHRGPLVCRSIPLSSHQAMG